MKEFFDTFEAELQAISEQLEILEDWHLAKGHTGASDIVGSLNGTITGAWIDFQVLREKYEANERKHDEIVESNIKYLLGELYEHEAEIAKLLKYDKVDTLLFDLLAKYSRVALKRQQFSVQNL